MSKLKLGLVALFAGLLLAPPASAEVSLRGNTVSVRGNTVIFEVAVSSVGYDLRLSGPGNFFYQERFEAGSLMSWTAAGVEDGLYKYELVPVAVRRERGVDTPDSTPVAETLSGAIRVQAGTLADPNRPEKLTKDFTHMDDVIIPFSLCVGSDCVNGESFGDDTIRLKEDNLRIHFDDTSTGSFPANDWRLVANDTTNGGASYFAIEDSTAGHIPFLVEAGAPANALYIEADGDIGIGTNGPSEAVHIRRTDATATTLLIENTNATTQVARVLLTNSANSWDVRNTMAGTFAISLSGSGLPLEFQLDTSGNVNIPGTIITGGGTCGGGCDQVFSPDYPLESIEDHASKMWANSYLPAVGPTVENEPINLSSMTGGMLNELEKAHIYIDQLHTAMKELEKRLEAVEAEKKACE